MINLHDGKTFQGVPIRFLVFEAVLIGLFSIWEYGMYWPPNERFSFASMVVITILVTLYMGKTGKFLKGEARVENDRKRKAAKKAKKNLDVEAGIDRSGQGR